jgi:F0F1-type ATP synthase assembly protein I
MAFQIAACIILGLLLGKWLDKKFGFNSHILMATFSILGVFIGVFFTIRDLLKNK